MYATDDLLDNPEFAIQVFTKLKEEREQSKQLQAQNNLLIKQNQEMKPLANFAKRKLLKQKILLAWDNLQKCYTMKAYLLVEISCLNG